MKESFIRLRGREKRYKVRVRVRVCNLASVGIQLERASNECDWRCISERAWGSARGGGE
jgi:hypothetical protein